MYVFVDGEFDFRIQKADISQKTDFIIIHSLFKLFLKLKILIIYCKTIHPFYNSLNILILLEEFAVVMKLDISYFSSKLL